MKCIVIACDGTWKRVDAGLPTNVVRLAQAVLPETPGGVMQLTCHLDGVGSGRGTGGVARRLDRLLGGAFGMGLTGTIEAAYRFLIFNHAPGDEVFLFGFSRGAYTARSLAGLIRNCGILRRDAVAMIPAALALYRERAAGTRPDSALAQAFRARHAREGSDEVRYLGVWDTVGALGVPGHLRSAQFLNRGLGFHDMRLSRGVRAARHAVAIDERRRSFPPALWDNLADLADGGHGPYQQRWFPGDHGSVGGGGAVRALSDDALLWVAEGATEAGLALEPAALADWRRRRDWHGPLCARGTGRQGILAALLALDAADRAGPAWPDDLADAAVRRWHADPSYRPRALARVAAGLGAPVAVAA